MSLKIKIKDNLKKIKLKYISVILFYVIIFLLGEFYAALVINNPDEAHKAQIPKKKELKEIIAKFDYFRFTTFEKEYVLLKKYFRPPAGLNYTNKRPIIFFIDSYTYGYGLENEQTLPYKISQYAKRPVYNYSIWGWGIQHILWLLRNEKDLDDIKNPEYAVYLLIEDHFRRVVTPFPFSDVPYSAQLYREKKREIL